MIYSQIFHGNSTDRQWYAWNASNERENSRTLEKWLTVSLGCSRLTSPRNAIRHGLDTHSYYPDSNNLSPRCSNQGFLKPCCFLVSILSLGFLSAIMFGHCASSPFSSCTVVQIQTSILYPISNFLDVLLFWRQFYKTIPKKWTLKQLLETIMKTLFKKYSL